MSATKTFYPWEGKVNSQKFTPNFTLWEGVVGGGALNFKWESLFFISNSDSALKNMKVLFLNFFNLKFDF